MKRIALLTFHRAVNYGAIFQSYALQRQLCNLGAQCVIIDYRCPVIEDQYKPFYLEKHKTVKSLVRILLKGKLKSKNRNSFYRFLNEHMVLSKSYRTISELEFLNQEFDLFITGSDQVWNPDCAAMDPAYFLDFVWEHDKKNSYAASFGFSEIPEDLKETYHHRLVSFHNISVREQSGVRIIRELLGREASFDLDPTLLLSCDEWAKIAHLSYPNRPYLLIYTVMEPLQLLDRARQIAKRSNLKILYLNNSLKLRFENPDLHFLLSGSPEEFLSLIRNARYVLTNSFHGTAFSILFHKQFLVELTGRNGNRNNRAESLLNLLGLSERVMDRNGCPRSERTVDWA